MGKNLSCSVKKQTKIECCHHSGKVYLRIKQNQETTSLPFSLLSDNPSAKKMLLVPAINNT